MSDAHAPGPRVALVTGSTSGIGLAIAERLCAEGFHVAFHSRSSAVLGRELAARLSRVRPSELTVPLEETQGVVETRGARLGGAQVHSVRLPGYTISAEILFGMTDQRLSIRHDSGNSAEPYVDGALLAIRKVGSFVGLRRGLDAVLDFT
mgnify:CR=1 FL=1